MKSYPNPNAEASLYSEFSALGTFTSHVEELIDNSFVTNNNERRKASCFPTPLTLDVPSPSAAEQVSRWRHSRAPRPCTLFQSQHPSPSKTR